MNIHKFFNKVFLISAALFWTSCSDDISNNNPVNLQSPDSQGQDIRQTESSSSISSGSQENLQPESSSSIASSSDSQEDIQPESSSSIASSSSRQRTCSEKTEISRLPKEPISLTKNDAIENAEFAAQLITAEYVMSEVHSRPNACREKYPKGTPFCLAKMADSLGELLTIKPLYGAQPLPDNIIKELVCDDGTTYVTEQYLAYEKQLEEYNKQKSIYEEYFEQAYDKRLAEYTTLLDSCINHPDDFNPADEEELRAYEESLCDIDVEDDDEDESK